MGPVLAATGWLRILFLISRSCLNNSVIDFCFLVSSEKICSYLVSLLIHVLVWYLFNTVHESICCSVSLCPHPRGQVVSEYIPLKSLLIPITVRVRSLNKRFLLSLLKRGLDKFLLCIKGYQTIRNIQPNIFHVISDYLTEVTKKRVVFLCLVNFSNQFSFLFCKILWRYIILRHFRIHLSGTELVSKNNASAGVFECSPIRPLSRAWSTGPPFQGP